MTSKIKLQHFRIVIYFVIYFSLELVAITSHTELDYVRLYGVTLDNTLLESGIKFP